MNMNVKNIQEIVDLASAYYGSCVLFAALDCDVFEKIESGVFDASQRGMRLLADACVAEGLLEKKDGTYFNTPASREALVPGGKVDLTKAIRYNRDVYPAWGKLSEFALTGKPVENPEIHLGKHRYDAPSYPHRTGEHRRGERFGARLVRSEMNLGAFDRLSRQGKFGQFSPGGINIAVITYGLR